MSNIEEIEKQVKYLTTLAEDSLFANVKYLWDEDLRISGDNLYNQMYTFSDTLIERLARNIRMTEKPCFLLHDCDIWDSLSRNHKITVLLKEIDLNAKLCKLKRDF